VEDDEDHDEAGTPEGDGERRQERQQEEVVDGEVAGRRRLSWSSRPRSTSSKLISRNEKRSLSKYSRLRKRRGLAHPA